MILSNSTPLDDIDFQEGHALLIDKPLDWTSFDVVNKIRFSIRYKYGIKKIKVGHAGTLDPLATGLLILCTGKWTKKIHEFQGLDKEYLGTFKLGATTATYDSEADEDKQYPIDHITEQALLEAVDTFKGEIDQYPPIYSAVKIKGQAAYKLARKGKDVVMKSRKVIIHDFKLENRDLQNLQVYVHCSKGTYIRSLAHDFGKKLESGGYLSSLRRTKIGQYDVSNAFPLFDLVDKLT